MKTTKEFRGNSKFAKQRAIAPVVLVAFFVYAVLPTNLLAAECIDWDGDGWGWDGEKGCKMESNSDKIKLKAPTTINNKIEEVKDGAILHNDLPQAIPVEKEKLCIDQDGDGWGWDGEKGCKMPVLHKLSNVLKTIQPPKVSPCVDWDGDGWGWDGEKGCKMEVLKNVSDSLSNSLKVQALATKKPCVDWDGDGWGWDGEKGCKSNDSEGKSIVKKILAKTGGVIKNAVQGAYATQPFNNVKALFNNENYARLKQDADTKRKNDLNKAGTDRNKRTEALKKLYEETLLRIKQQLESKTGESKQALVKLKDFYLQKYKQLLNQAKLAKLALENATNKAKAYQTEMATLLNKYYVAKAKAEEHKKAAEDARKESKESEEKYRKYKKKYKKKKKSKYKHRYKKYKKKYRLYADRYDIQKNRYKSYEKLRLSYGREYNALKAKLAQLGNLSNYQVNYNSLGKETLLYRSKLAEALKNIENQEREQVKAENTSEYQALTKKAKNDYDLGIKEVNNIYYKRTMAIEDTHSKDLRKAEAYGDVVEGTREDKQPVSKTVEEQLEELLWVEMIREQFVKEIEEAKNEANQRISGRYEMMKDLASWVYSSIVDNAKITLANMNKKVLAAKLALDKVKDSTKKERHKYEERKDEVDDMKDRWKSYKKYSKKAKKYKGKSDKKSKKKYEKYKAKAKHALDKYKRSLKDVKKWGGTTDHYKQAYKSLENLVRQYEGQYGNTLTEQRAIITKYNTILAQAEGKKHAILAKALTEKDKSFKRLATVDYPDYGTIGIYEEKLNVAQYFQGISTIQVSGGVMGAQVGLDTAHDITKETEKIAKKVKKKYKKYLKKQAEKIAIAKQAETSKKVYKKVASSWPAEEAYVTRGSVKLIAVKGKKDNLLVKLFGGLASVSSLAIPSNIPKQKKGWLGKLKDWGEGIKDSLKDSAKSLGNGIKNVWEKSTDFISKTWSTVVSSTKEAVNTAINSGKKTWGVVTDSIEGAVTRAWDIAKTGGNYLGELLKDIWQEGSSLVIDGAKSLVSDISNFAGKVGAWYTGRTKEALIPSGIILAPFILKSLNPVIKLGVNQYSPKRENKSVWNSLTAKLRGWNKFFLTNWDVLKDIWNNHIADNTNDISRDNLIIKHRGTGKISSWFREGEIEKKAKIISEKTGYSYEEAVKALKQIGENSLSARLVYNRGTVSEQEAREILIKDGFREITREERVDMGLKNTTLIDETSGLEVRVYINHRKNQIHFAFAGTEDLLKDGLTNLSQGVGEETKQYSDVIKIAGRIKDDVIQKTDNKFHNYVLSSSAHSLGGGENSLFDAITGISGMGFNSSGLHPNTLQQADVHSKEFPNILNIRTNNDMLTYAQEYAGNSEAVDLKMILTAAEKNQELLKMAVEIFGEDSSIGQYDKQIKTALKIKRAMESNDIEDIKALSSKSGISLTALVKLQKHWNNPNLQINQEMPDPIGTQITVKKGLKDYAVQLYASFLDDVILNDSTDDLIENAINYGYRANQHGQINYYK